MLRIGLAPCSPFTVTTDLMVAAAALARRYEGVRLHTHLAENQEDIDYSLEVYGCRPGQYIKCASASNRVGETYTVWQSAQSANCATNCKYPTMIHHEQGGKALH